jgi:hypothetical protein
VRLTSFVYVCHVNPLQTDSRGTSHIPVAALRTPFFFKIAAWTPRKAPHQGNNRQTCEMKQHHEAFPSVISLESLSRRPSRPGFVWTNTCTDGRRSIESRRQQQTQGTVANLGLEVSKGRRKSIPCLPNGCAYPIYTASFHYLALLFHSRKARNARYTFTCTPSTHT